MPLRGWRGGVVFFCAACLVSPGADLPNPHAFEGQRIVAVRFDPPSQPLTPAELSNILPLRPNTTYKANELQNAIRRLYATGRYDSIAAEGQPAPGGVAVVFHTTSQWFVGRVEVEGKIKSPPNAGQLAAASRLELGRPLGDADLQNATAAVQHLMQQNGFYNAQIKSQTWRDNTHQQVHIRFTVDPGKRAKFDTPVIAGDPKIKAEDLAKATHFHRFLIPGYKQVTEERVERGVQGIRRRYQKDHRLMATVRVKERKYEPGTNRMVTTFDVSGGPKVELKAVGAKISGSKMKKYVPVFDEGAADRDLLVQGAHNLRDYFQNEGYFDVEVDFQQKQVSPDHEQIVYVINLGRRQKLVKVDLQGNHYFDDRTITERMYVQPAGMLRLRHGRYSAGFVRRDEATIKSLYTSNGFGKVNVKFQTIDDYKGKPDEMAVVVRIDEGQQIVVSDIQVTGIQQLNPDQIVPMLASVKNEPFSQTNVAMDRTFILELYNNSGFPDATFDWTQKNGPGANQVSLHYTINEGKRRYVRDVLVAGMEVTNPRLTRPAMHIHAGQPLALNGMTDTQHNLYNLGVFEKVDTAIQNPDGDTQDKYVLYQLEEGSRYHLAVGFGAEIAKIGGSSTSYANPAGATGFSPRLSVDASRLNMWGLGHTLNFKGRLSTLEQFASLNYLAPRYRNVAGRNISVTGTYDDSRLVRTFTSKRVEGAVQLSQELTRATTVLWRYDLRRTTISDLKISPLLVPLFQAPARIGMIEGSLINDRRDDPTDAHRGIYTTLNSGLAAGPLASHTDFGRFLFTNSSYYTIHGDYVLARRIEFGWIAPFNRPAGVSSADVIPLPERFFGGGSTSLRGFPDNQAGPRDPLTGFPLGGNALLIHNTELRFPFIGDNIRGIIFHDMGNVYSTLGDISFRIHQKNLNDFNYMVHAVGFGIRYRTPLGPIRVDLAYSLNPPQFFGFKGTPQQLLSNTAPRVQQGISHFQFFISIGQAF